MAAIIAVLNALRRAVQRRLWTFQSIKLNNFFLFAMLLVYGALVSGMKPVASTPFLVLVVFLLLFPLSGDPLDDIPATRLQLWPLTRGQWWALRLASLGMSPVLWLGLLILLTTASLEIALLFLVAAIGVQGLSSLGGYVASRLPRLSPQRHVPQLPGLLGGLIRKNVREMMSMLDVYVAVVVSIAGSMYRWLHPHPDPAAFPILAFLVALALSTYAQSLFGLDTDSAITRYRLLPLAGWQILLAKDAAFLGILFLLVLALSPGPGLTFGLAALAIGHYPSILRPMPQKRWRFTGGSFRFGALQILVGTALGLGEYQREPWFLLLAATVYLASLHICGREWDLA